MSGVEIVFLQPSTLTGVLRWAVPVIIFLGFAVFAYSIKAEPTTSRTDLIFVLTLMVIVPLGVYGLLTTMADSTSSAADYDATTTAVEDHYGVGVPDWHLTTDGGVLDVHIEAPNGDLSSGAVRRDGDFLFLYRSVAGDLVPVEPADG